LLVVLTSADVDGDLRQRDVVNDANAIQATTGKKVSQRMPKLILFDIDGTLISSDGAGIEALNSALQDLCGVQEGFREVSCAGKTDIQIIREGLDTWGIEADGLIPQFVDRYLAHLRAAMSKSRGHVKPGVRELLQTLQEHEDVSLGLLTGNLETGARIKLDPYGLTPFFPLGAYGSDDQDRNRLLPIAADRLSQKKGIAVGYGDCVVVGDTPRDVTCAQVHGAPCIAVATGPYAVEALEKTGADLVVRDLSDTDRILVWIIGERGT
jgi:phosphoglycolate phosphatase-like HAD superfamily hydrolase